LQLTCPRQQYANVSDLRKIASSCFVVRQWVDGSKHDEHCGVIFLLGYRRQGVKARGCMQIMRKPGKGAFPCRHDPSLLLPHHYIAVLLSPLRNRGSAQAPLAPLILVHGSTHCRRCKGFIVLLQPLHARTGAP